MALILPEPAPPSTATDLLEILEHLAFDRTPDSWARFDRCRLRVRAHLGTRDAEADETLTAFLDLMNHIEAAAGRDGQGRTKVLTVGGRPFHCTDSKCGSNCFHQPHPVTRPDVYQCNGCGTQYSGA